MGGKGFFVREKCLKRDALWLRQLLYAALQQGVSEQGFGVDTLEGA